VSLPLILKLWWGIQSAFGVPTAIAIEVGTSGFVEKHTLRQHEAIARANVLEVTGMGMGIRRGPPSMVGC